MAQPSNLFSLPAFMLLRKSRADEEEEKKAKAEGRTLDVLRTHRAILCDLAGKDGAAISYICEELQSGERLSSRPEFQKFLQHLRSLPKPGGILYVIHAERITRGLLSERGLVQDLFIEKEVLIREPGGITNLDNADERLLFEVKGSLAHHYLGRYKERVALTRTLQLREGRVRNGSVPFGYDWDPKGKVPFPHPQEFPILKAICRDAFTCSLYDLVAKYHLSKNRIHLALTSPTICGWPARTTGQRLLANGRMQVYYLPREQWVWPEKQGDYPRAMERDEWERLQKVLIARRKGRLGRGTENHWCRDVVRINGHAVRLGTASNKEDVPTYETATRLFVPRAVVHAEVKRELREIFASETDLLTHVKAQATRRPQSGDITGLEARREGLRAELAALERRAALLEGERLAAVESASQAVERELEEVKRQLASASRQAPALSGEEAAMLSRIAHRFSTQFEQAWDLLQDSEKRAVVRLLVESVEVSCEKVGKCYARTVSVNLPVWLKE